MFQRGILRKWSNGTDTNLPRTFIGQNRTTHTGERFLKSHPLNRKKGEYAGAGSHVMTDFCF
jgi:hypothetical protein